MKKRIFITTMIAVFLLSSCYGQVLIRFNRIERALFGESIKVEVLNRTMYNALFWFGDRQYYFHARTTSQGEGLRPNFLGIDNYAEEVEYYIGVFRREQTFSDSSLSSESELYLYRGDFTVPGSACASYPCAVYWLEDRRHNEVFVSVNSF